MRLRLLNGLKVLEVGDRVSAAYCGKLLADMGAEVTMVEPPGRGSRIRRLPPYYEDVPGPDRSVLHQWLNSNKRSVTLRLENGEGKAIFRKMIEEADVLIEGLDEGGVSGGRLNYEDLRRINPGLTVTSITPFGSGGPYSNYRASDLIIFAMSGYATDLACPVDDPASTPPRLNPSHQVGLVAGIIAGSATLWGMLAGKRKGEGVTVDLAEWEAFSYLLTEQPTLISEGEYTPGRKRPPGPEARNAMKMVWCFPCSDGWVMASPREDHQFKQWASLMGNPEWTSREEFSTSQSRELHTSEIWELSAAWTIKQKKGELYRMAQERRIPCFPVSLLSDLPQLEQLRHRNFWVETDHPVIRGLRYPGTPMRTDLEPAPFGSAPGLGEHTLEVYTRLGLSPAELKNLWTLGVI